jgi:K+-transporting ATPase ATPase A chain
MAILAILIPSLAVLFGSALAVLLPSGRAAPGNAGPHGLSEILYAFASASQNNGSAFGGLGADTPFYNSTLALCMLLGRFGVILPVLAMAGNLAEKRSLPEGPGTFPTRGTLFAGLLASVVLIVGALTYLPALSLGPVAEQLSMLRGRLF